MGGAVIAAALPRALFGELDRQARHVALGRGGPLGNSLDGLPVAIARGEIHLAVDTGGLRPEDALHSAKFLDEFPPVHRPQ